MLRRYVFFCLLFFFFLFFFAEELLVEFGRWGESMVGVDELHTYNM